MGTKKVGGYIFRTYITDHRHYHGHVFKNDRFLGRFDIENQKPLTKKLKITKAGRLAKALRAAEYLK